jgi:putative DNA methylase
MLAIVAEGKNGRLYFDPNAEHNEIANIKKPNGYPTGLLSGKSKVNVGPYGFKDLSELYTNRQLNALVTLSELICMTKKEIKKDNGSDDYALAVCTYLSFVINKQADFASTIATWINVSQSIRNTFARQAIPMTWDYVETNIFSNSTGSFSNMLNLIGKSVENFPNVNIEGNVMQANATTDNELREIMISTDPPYYDNISYADLSDYFYIWLRLSLKNDYPDLFQTLLVPKTEELVATQYRFGGNRRRAMDFFESGMLEAFKLINTYVIEDIPTTVYYAYKQSENYGDSNASTGWETMLSAIIQAGFSITGTWPIRTERSGRMLDIGKNALASSIVLVCRKRNLNAKICTRRDFINSLKRELKIALKKLQESNIAPVDLAQSAIGPGMAVYSRYSKVLEADGTPMSVRSALQIINQELDLYFTEQDGVLDRDSRFCVDLYTQYAFNDVKFGEADVLARAKNTSVEGLAGQRILYAEKSIVRLLTREEIPDYPDSKNKGVIWLLTQQLTHALEQKGINGAAKIVADIFSSEPEHAKALAYRLFQIAERKGWAQEAYAYNSLVIAWPEILNRASEMTAYGRVGEQISLYNIGDKK